MTTLIAIFIINACLAVVYAIVKIAQHEPSKGIGLALFFICIPVLGFVFYFVPVFIQAFLSREGVDSEAILPHEIDIEHQPERPDIKDELNVVPVEDAMAVSSNSEKRSLLLKQMEKDWQYNFKSLLVAEKDSDSETAHYAAAEKMGIYRDIQDKWLQASKAYDEHPGDPKYFHVACDALDEVFDSEVFPEAEVVVYQRRLTSIVQAELDSNPSEVTDHECEACLHALVALGQFDAAQAFWNNYKDRLQSEAAYKDTLKMYYEQGNFAAFEQQLDELRENRRIRLSADGLSDLRYWLNRVKQSKSMAGVS